MSDNEKLAYFEGQTAAIDGKAATDNTYPLGTSHSRAWARGWRAVHGQLISNPRKPA